MPKPRLTVMVSSTSRDLEGHRDQSRSAILRVGWYPEMMEHDGSAPETALERSLRYVDEADVYLLILGFRYGSIPEIAENPKRLSYTELEYRYALERQARGELVVLTFLMHDDHERKIAETESDPDKLAKLNAFRAEVSDASQRGVSAFFRSKEELKEEVLDALYKLALRQNWQHEPAKPAAPSGPTPEAIRAYFETFLVGTQKQRKKDVDDIAQADLRSLAPTLSSHLPQVSISRVGDSIFDDDEDDAPAPVEPEGDYQRGDQAPQRRVLNVRTTLRDFRRGVLLGQPGSGKTWTLLMLMGDYYERWQQYPESALIPVFVPLNSYRGEQDFAAFVRQQMGGLADHAEALAHRLMYLCDALNEMPNQERTLPQVKGFLRDKPHFIVSCRVLDYQQKLDELRPLELLNLRELELPAIKRLIFSYVPAAKGGEALWKAMGGSAALEGLWDKLQGKGEAERFWDARADLLDYTSGEEDRAWRAMHKGGRFIPLCRSPFMAKLLCSAYLNGKGELPKERGALFQSFISAALSDQAQRDPHFPQLDRIEAALVALAEAMQARKVTVLQRQGADAPAVMPEGHLLDAAIAASILVGDAEQVRFQHQLFQEYFATRVLLRALEAGESAAPFFGERWWEAGVWRETIVILGELQGANEVAAWLAPVTPELALDVLLKHGAGLTLDDLSSTARAALIASARAKLLDVAIDPRGRAAAGRVLGKLNADDRPGVGLIPAGKPGAGLPDIEWCDIPAGTFLYGDDKKPITIPHSFKMSKYLITYAQYQCFLDAPDFDAAAWWADMPSDVVKRYNQQWPISNHPRERVTWYQAVAFTRWLTARYRAMGLLTAQEEIRLPTEFEWEYAARGTDGRVYPYGDTFDARKCNGSATGIGQTSAAGIFPNGASPFDLLDMSGNVWEWCLNKYDDLGDISIDVMGARRALRGGSFNFNINSLRAASRVDYSPDNLNYNVGFRCSLFSP